MFRGLQIIPRDALRFWLRKASTILTHRQVYHRSRLIDDITVLKQVSCSFPLLGVLAAGCHIWCGRGKVQAEELQQKVFSAEEKRALEAMCEEAMQIMVGYVDEPEEFWQSRQVWKDPAGEIVIRAAAVAGFSTRVFMGSARIDGTTLAELALSIQGHPGCRKERWDPIIDKFIEGWRFESKKFEPVQPGSQQPWIALITTMTKPALLGLISRRSVDDICLGMCKVPGSSKGGQRTRYFHGAIGVKTPHAKNALRKHGFAGTGEGMALLNRLIANSVSTSLVVMTDHSSGFVVEDLGNGSFLLNYIIHSDPAGGLPNWATDKSIPQSEADFLKLLRKDLKAQRSEKIEE